MSASSRRVIGVLLDIDGTLLDSNDAHAQSWVEIFRRYGYDIPFGRVRPLIGKGSDKLLPELTGLDSETGKGKQMTEERKQLFLRDYLSTLRPTNGARDLVERLRDDGFRLVVATSSGGDELDQLLRQSRVDDLIEQATRIRVRASASRLSVRLSVTPQPPTPKTRPEPTHTHFPALRGPPITDRPPTQQYLLH